jgi:hypothetical protein
MKSKKCCISVLWTPYQLVCGQVLEAYCWDYVKETLRVVNVKTAVSIAIANFSVVIGKKTFAGCSVLCHERLLEN